MDQFSLEYYNSIPKISQILKVFLYPKEKTLQPAAWLLEPSARAAGSFPQVQLDLLNLCMTLRNNLCTNTIRVLYSKTHCGLWSVLNIILNYVDVGAFLGILF